MLTEEELLKREDNYDRMLLWKLIVKQINPVAHMSVATLNDKLELVTLSDFQFNIKVFNTWFLDKMNAIIREVGTEGYT
eukprot:15338874-Ditylum_brightwellii.AAC.1